MNLDKKIKEAQIEIDECEAEVKKMQGLISESNDFIAMHERRKAIVYYPQRDTAYDLKEKAKKTLEELQQQQKEQSNDR